MARGRKTEASGKRVGLAGSRILVSGPTAARLEAWRDMMGVPIGRSIDALVALSLKDESFVMPAKWARPSLLKKSVDQGPVVGEAADEVIPNQNENTKTN